MSTTTTYNSKQQAFYDEADERFDNILGGKETIPWEQMRQYLIGRQAGQTDLISPQPKPQA